jgi:hypothetical protein
LEAIGSLLGLILGESDGKELHGSLESEGVEALLERLVHILEGLRSNVVHLVKSLYSVLDDLGHGDDLVHGLAH